VNQEDVHRAVAADDVVAIVGVVVIGRNEGERLRRCLESFRDHHGPVVYVDSGSSDGSPALAASTGARVIALTADVPFTAARARNEGWRALLDARPDLRLVQFVDGDCEVAEGWISRATAALEERPDVAAVSGRRRERYPDASPYNRLCDLEWDTPVGEAKYFGGDVMIRMAALRETAGYGSTIIAGEDPELALRLRKAGWRVFRLDCEMTRHDAAMFRFAQWWRRAVRSGHAYAEGASMHGAPPERHFISEARSNWTWGLWLPLAVAVLAFPTRGLSLVGLAAYPLLGWRVYRGARRDGRSTADAGLYAAACVVGKLPGAIGQITYVWRRLRGRRSTLIEYKSSGG
jgi:glycosyltransferase involved in cell wall biosynthesis